MLEQLQLGPDHVVRFFLGEHGVFLGEHRLVIRIGVIFVRLVVGIGARRFLRRLGAVLLN